MERRKFLATIAAGTSTSAVAYWQTTGWGATQLQSGECTDMSNNKDYFKTWDANGDLRHKYTKDPSVGSVDVDKEVLTGGSGPLAVYLNSDSNVEKVATSTIQAAVDAIPSISSTESNGPAGQGGVVVYPKDGAYTNSFTLDEGGMKCRLATPSTYVDVTGSHAATITAQDITLSGGWIDQTDSSGSYDAINVDAPEVVVDDIDIDNAPRYGVHITANSGKSVVTPSVAAIGGDTAALRCNESLNFLAPVIIQPTAKGMVIDANRNRIFTAIGGATDALTISSSHNFGFLRTNSNTGTSLVISGNENTIHMEDFNSGSAIDVSGTENIIKGHWTGSISDTGTRNVINGYGTNNGDPNTTGDWNTNATFAYRMGAVVWDTSTSPWTPYRADGAGNWISI